MGRRISWRVGFTVTEMLVVIAIIGVMMALLLPAVQMVREAGRKTNCANNLTQIGKAFAQHNVQWGMYASAGAVPGPSPPAPADECDTLRAMGGNNTPLQANNQSWGWAYQILPYLEKDGPYLDPDPRRAASLVVSNYFCSSRRRPQARDGDYCGIGPCPRGALDYAGNGGTQYRVRRPSALLFPDPSSWVGANGAVIPHADPLNVGLGEISDGASSTILVGERNFNRLRMADPTQRDENNGYIAGYSWDSIRWGYAIPAADREDIASDSDTRFGSSHPLITQFVLCDGSVKSLNISVNLTVFQGLCDRDSKSSPSWP